MPRNRGLRRMPRFAALLPLIFLASCAKPPPVVSGDLSCERFRHISATEPQIAAMGNDWDLWESYAVQIASHNVEYDADCLEKTKKQLK